AAEAILRAVQARLPDPMPLHPAARAARPRRRRQGAGDPGVTPPVGRPAPPDPATQAGTRRPSPARRDQPYLAPVPLVLFHRDPTNAAALASANDRRRLDLPTSRTRAAAARQQRAADG